MPQPPSYRFLADVGVVLAHLRTVVATEPHDNGCRDATGIYLKAILTKGHVSRSSALFPRRGFAPQFQDERSDDVPHQ